jgi:DNA-binding beta-propeller fold protein YncE
LPARFARTFHKHLRLAAFIAIITLGLLFVWSVDKAAYAATYTVTTFASGFNDPTALAFDSSGNLYVANYGTNTVSKVTPSGIVSTFATVGTYDSAVLFDTAGNLYVGNFNNNIGNIVSKVTPSGTVSRVPGSSFGLIRVEKLAFDSSGNLYVGTPGDTHLYKITPDGISSPIPAGTNSSDVAAAIALDTSGNLYIANSNYNTVTKETAVESSGGETTFATVGSEPDALAFDSSGNLYVANEGSGTISKITPSGAVTTFATVGSEPDALIFDTSGNLYVANYGSGTVSEVTPSGSAITVATVGSEPDALAFDSSGNLYVANAGSNTVSKITISAPAPTCSISLSPNPSAYAYSGTPVALTWSSSNADEVYIENVGWVNASGSTQVASQQTASYACYGYSAAYGNGAWDTTNTTLTVTLPSAPSVTVSASSTSIYTSQSTNVTAVFAAGSGDQLTADNIDEPYGTGIGATTNPDASKTVTFSPTQAGTYTFYAMATTDAYPTWAAYASTTITVLAAPSCTAATSYSCTGSGNSVITQTSTSTNCAVTVTNISTCTSPQFCQSGSNQCLAPAIAFNQSGNYTGNLQLIPTLLQSGETAQVHWSVSDAQSCIVTGTNGDSWTGLSSPTNGETSKPINSQTIYTLACVAFGNNPNLTEMATVNVAPTFEEK